MKEQPIGAQCASLRVVPESCCIPQHLMLCALCPAVLRCTTFRSGHSSRACCAPSCASGSAWRPPRESLSASSWGRCAPHTQVRLPAALGGAAGLAKTGRVLVFGLLPASPAAACCLPRAAAHLATLCVAGAGASLRAARPCGQRPSQPLCPYLPPLLQMACCSSGRCPTPRAPLR